MNSKKVEGVGVIIEPSYQEICAFIYAEARFQDEHLFDEWEALWTDDALYWVPNGGDDTDPEKQISIIYDNRARIRTRCNQLKSGVRYSQAPASSLRRIVGNIEILDRSSDSVRVGANFLIFEARYDTKRIWAGRTDYTLTVEDGRLRLQRKKVLLADAEGEVPTLAFLI
jgi:3-phenylpropionate/cinnamic acid dioxygenase small subunit